MLEKTLDSPLDCKEIKAVKFSLFIGRVDAEAKAPMFWPSAVKVKVAQSCPTLCDPMDSRVEYWSGKPFPFPGDLPIPGIEPRCLALQADYLAVEPHLMQRTD